MISNQTEPQAFEEETTSKNFPLSVNQSRQGDKLQHSPSPVADYTIPLGLQPCAMEFLNGHSGERKVIESHW